MHRPSLQLHTWLISFSLLNSFPVTFMSFASFGRENFIHDNCFKPRQQFEDREQYVYFYFSLSHYIFVTISSSPAFTDLFVQSMFLSVFLLFLLCLRLTFSYFFLSCLESNIYILNSFFYFLHFFLLSDMLFILYFVCLLNCLFFFILIFA